MLETDAGATETAEVPAPDAPAPQPSPDPERAAAARLAFLRRVDQVTRALSYALREDGDRLWEMRWVERSCRPVLLALLRSPDVPQELISPLAEASDLLEGLDAKPWVERVVPTREALASLSAVAVPPTSDLLRDLAPRAQLIEVDAPQMPRTPVPAPAPKKKKKRGRRAREEAEAPRSPKPPPPPPSRPLRHPEHTGRPLSVLEGTPPALVEGLRAAGVETIADLLLLEPAGHDLFELTDDQAPLSDDGVEIAVSGRVRARWTRLGPAGSARELALECGERTFRCVWRASLTPDLAALAPGAEIALIGRLEIGESGPVLYEPMRWRTASQGSGGDSALRRPRYGLEGVDEDALRRLIRQALETHIEQLVDPLPPAVLKDGRVLGISAAFRERHVPRFGPRRGRTRFIFQELFLHQLASVSQKPLRFRGISHEIHHTLFSQLQLQFGIELTDSQEAAFSEIRRDLRRPVAMTRLLQGDVGAGKALVAMLSAVMVAEARSQVLFLAPDALTAEHRFLFAEPLIRAAGLVPQLISDRPSGTQKDALKRGATHIVFSTHELARTGLPEFRRLGLVVVEERGAYGGIKRDWLASKNTHPDLLVTTAVPIPSSLVFTIFNDHDLSIIDLDPPQQVRSLAGGAELREDTYQILRDHVAAGRQAYVIFPLIRGRDLIERERAEALAAALAREAFGGARVAVYHGSMPQEERWRVFEDFQHRRIDVLLATTLIEEGPGVENAKVMIVENADRFDLVRLHRLRGHVANAASPGLCAFVLSENPDPEGQERVELLVRERDGFAIAERDREARGDQALLGTRAEEIPDFRWVDAARDRDLLLRAREAAFGVVTRDPQFRQPGHKALADLLGITPRQSENSGRRRRGRGRRRKR